MQLIDKNTEAFIHATDAEVQQIDQEIQDPSTNAPIKPPTRRQRPEEVQYFLKANTLSILERLHNIATDSLYTRDETGTRQRIFVPAGVQLQAAMGFLDRAMGKPQVNIDLTSGDRPIVFDQAFAAPPLIQGAIAPVVDVSKDELTNDARMIVDDDTETPGTQTPNGHALSDADELELLR